MKLHIKLTITLLLISLSSISMVGGIAYWMLLRDFRQAVLDEAFNNFQADIVDYLSFYGDWHNAEQHENFHQFVQRKRHGNFRRPPPNSRMPGPEHDVGLHRPGRPPFLFLVLAPSGKVLKPANNYVPGETVADDIIQQGRPISIDGEVAVLAVPLGDPNLTPQDRNYLAAMRQAIITGVVVAIPLTLLLGLLLGRRIGGPLTELTRAIHAMHGNAELEQNVSVRSNDEIGELALAFNHMSTELARTHTELLQTNETMQAQAEQLRELSIRDPLTHLYNRRHFNEQAATLYKQAQRYQRPLSIMVADLDWFKSINDNFSHTVGDEVLRRVAEILRDNTRDSDIVARYGGEEFVITFAESPLHETLKRCEAIRHSVESHPWHEVANDLQVTMSIGVSDNVALGGFEKMVAEADERLYQAKHNGRNQVVPVAA
ncbi:MAG: diguanylate cyclase [Chromatiales bacterium]|jgi:diguanylate cyclase (GGDEF)-like protein